MRATNNMNLIYRILYNHDIRGSKSVGLGNVTFEIVFYEMCSTRVHIKDVKLSANGKLMIM